MRAKILDRRQEDRGECYLCRVTLEAYVSALPDTYQEYEIQREIVSNVYLDRLVETVLQRRHIPPIVLVASSAITTPAQGELEVDSFKILDGLQRTHRLKAIHDTMRFCLEKLPSTNDYLSWNKYKFSRAFSSQLRELNSNTEILRVLLNFRQSNGDDAMLSTYRDNPQWFELWTGLSPADEVRKMLTLNAGHKPVRTRHQLELLFLNLLPVLQAGEGAAFVLVRERDTSATQFSKSRDVGTFHFAHIITALLSLQAGKPTTPTTGLVQSIQESDTTPLEYGETTSPDFLKEFVKFLVRIDRRLAIQYPGIGPLWMGREVSLAGLFGALGAYAIKTNSDRTGALTTFAKIVDASPAVLNLNEFEEQRNRVDLSKVNIGNVNRQAIYSAIQDILLNNQSRPVDWGRHFLGGDEESRNLLRLVDSEADALIRLG